jgi:hypothetical protein
MYDAVTNTPIDPLSLLAEKAAGEVYFLAHALHLHRERFGITEAEQRRHLGVRVQDWPMLCLCRMPAVEQWDEDLDVICSRFGCDRERLERAVKAGE